MGLDKKITIDVSNAKSLFDAAVYSWQEQDHKKAGEQNYEEAFKYFYRASELGDSEALACLGFFYEKGLGVRRDLATAVQYYDKAYTLGIKQVDAYRLILKLKKMSSLKNPVAMVKELGIEKELEDLEDRDILLFFADKESAPIAKFYLGKHYYNHSNASERVLLIAYRYFQSAAEDGFVQAHIYIGIMLEFEMIKLDSVKDRGQAALEQYRYLAKKNGDPVAKFALSICYRDGNGVRKNIRKSAQYFKEASESFIKKDPKAKQDDEEILKEAKFKAQVKLYQKASYRGHLEAYFILGHLYETGLLGDAKDVKIQMIELYFRAAYHGHLKAVQKLEYWSSKGEDLAIYYLGRAYCFGSEKIQDMPRGIALLDRAIRIHQNVRAKKSLENLAEYGIPLAQYTLAVLILEGLGGIIQQDAKRAHEWLHKAALQNESRAQSKLASILWDSYVGEYHASLNRMPDMSKAMTLFESAAKKEDAIALDRLGYCYENGIYYKEDVNRAKEHYEAAAALGNIHAMQRLHDLRQDSKPNNILRAVKVQPECSTQKKKSLQLRVNAYLKEVYTKECHENRKNNETSKRFKDKIKQNKNANEEGIKSLPKTLVCPKFVQDLLEKRPFNDENVNTLNHAVNRP